MKQTTVAMMLALLIASTLVLTQNTITVKAQNETIYIRPDGSIDPTTAPIQRTGNTYTFTNNIYEAIIVQRDNIIINGNSYKLQGSGSGNGIDLTSRTNVTLQNTYITQFNYGILLYDSHENQIHSNNLTGNLLRAISISNSSRNRISSNTVFDNLREGILVSRSNNNTVTNNNVTKNGEDGISLGYASTNNTLTNNNVSHNSQAGISFPFENSTSNTIMGNNITNNDWAGIYIDHSSSNIIYHNNIRDNWIQIVAIESTNAWDNGYPSGGNYWSDYTDIDLYWGSNQNRSGSDGIGDTPHTIDGSNRDNYPLMSPYEYWSNPIPGDINKDTKVDNKDLSQLTIAYGSTPEEPNWNPNSDINTDSIVNVSDLFRLGRNFGKPADNNAPSSDGKIAASDQWK